MWDTVSDVVKFLAALTAVVATVSTATATIMRSFVSREVKDATFRQTQEFTKLLAEREKDAQQRTDNLMGKVDQRFDKVTEALDHLDKKYAIEKIVETQFNEVARRIDNLEQRVGDRPTRRR